MLGPTPCFPGSALAHPEGTAQLSDDRFLVGRSQEGACCVQSGVDHQSNGTVTVLGEPDQTFDHLVATPRDVHETGIGGRDGHHLEVLVEPQDETGPQPLLVVDCEDHGLRVPDPIFGTWTGQSGYDAGVRLLEQGLPDAVFAASDLMALGMMRAFSEAGVRVPDDVSIVGFDDHEFAQQFTPPLTTVRQDFEALGARCLEVLFANSEEAVLTAPIRPRLLVRESTRLRGKESS